MDDERMRRAPFKRAPRDDRAGDDGDGAAESGQRWPRRVRRLIDHLPYVCGASAIAIAAVVLAGWFLDRPEWTAVVRGLPPMTPNSAGMAALAGAGVLLVAPMNVSAVRATIGRLCAALVSLVAGVTLIEHVFGVDVAIDRLLVTVGASSFNRYPGRPSPQTATAFALIGVSLFSMSARTPRGRWSAPVFAVIAALMPLIALLAYVFGTAELYGFASLRC